MKFGEKTRLLRNEKRLSQTGLGRCEVCLCGQSAIMRWLDNTRSAASDAEELVADVPVLFVGGELSEQDKDAVMRALQDAYWMAKERKKETNNIITMI